MTFSILTIVFALVLIVAAITGFRKGLLSQIGHIAGFIIGILASRALTPAVLKMLSVDAGADTASAVTTVLCYILVYLAAYFSIVMIAKIIKLVVKVACLGTVDRIAGAIFRLLEWGIILSLVFNLVAAVYAPVAPTDQSNALERSVYRLAPAVLDMWNTRTS